MSKKKNIELFIATDDHIVCDFCDKDILTGTAFVHSRIMGCFVCFSCMKIITKWFTQSKIRYSDVKHWQDKDEK